MGLQTPTTTPFPMTLGCPWRHSCRLLPLLPSLIRSTLLMLRRRSRRLGMDKDIRLTTTTLRCSPPPPLFPCSSQRWTLGCQGEIFPMSRTRDTTSTTTLQGMHMPRRSSSSRSSASRTILSSSRPRPSLPRINPDQARPRPTRPRGVQPPPPPLASLCRPFRVLSLRTSPAGR